MAGDLSGKEEIMDQKKTLWIIAAAGAFLLAVLGAAVIIYSPSKKSSYTAQTPIEQTAAPVTSSGWTTTTSSPAEFSTVQQPVEIPQNVPSTSKVGEMIVLADNATVYESDNSSEHSYDSTTIDINALKKDLAYEAQTSVKNVPQNINITVHIPETKSESPEYKAPEEVPVRIVEKPAKPIIKAEPVKKEAPKASAKPAAKSVQKTVTAVKTSSAAEKKVTQYWVQVAAYSNKKGAENARSILESNKIPSDIFTFQDAKNNLFYRVRVGPYTTKSEAEYWRTRIIKINEFSKAESFVTSTTN